MYIADPCPLLSVVIEDSMVGLRAAVGAGMKCLITYTPSTAAEDFYGEGAAAKVRTKRQVNEQVPPRGVVLQLGRRCMRFWPNNHCQQKMFELSQV